MDFVELPDGVEPEEVPDLGVRDYDNGDFSTYPQRQGWNLRALLDYDITAAYDSWDEASQNFGPALFGAFNGLNLDALEGRDFRSAVKAVARNMLLSVVGSFIQTWIMLGTLSVALRRPVSRDEVIEVKETIEENGEKTERSCISLRAAFAECVVNFRDHLEADSDWSADVLRSLRIGITFLDDMAKIPAPQRYCLLPRSVELSLLVLLSTIDLHQSFHSRRKLRANMYSCESLEQEMKNQRKWCPHVLYRLRALGGAQSLYYTALLPSFAVGGAHENCDEGICVAFNIDHGTYRTIHLEGCGDKNQHYICQDVRVSERDLGLMLEAGGYPLVCLEQGRLKLVRYEPGIQYVAISHVWSDGRGNPRQNALPLCQLRTIQRWVSNSAHKGTFFWIDTLCVPIKEPHRNTAIMRMAQTYEAASHVIVLSEELLMHNLPASPLQALYMIFYRGNTSQKATLPVSKPGNHFLNAK
ncbi:uncharacterized protein A1O5_06068 [Cladophialophora psammophila CBS 110553]|uniref:Heterokaryon incompatibility domain-containing protein n=1 Tax=Cladophialophora psammophila CBS 110553 TaxID=1182543 RepID=W9X179_9EURO|nr:uncharacterized protein A1O5_06068 [Cladophialophora psammophila CBS 110553]EXJ71075.1 hypothetical protein A1O5_06068 [Cladophialophora psammophila CBS 110553]